MDMTMPFRKISLVVACAVMGAAAVVPTSAVAASPEVPIFAFDDCPAIPAGADPTRWRCEEMHASGTIRLGTVTVPIALKTTHAEGRLPDDPQTRFIFGALRADPVRIPGRSAITVAPEYAGHIDFVAGPPMAEILHLRYRVRGRHVAGNCAIGTTTDPIVVVGEIVGERVPVQEEPLVLRFAVVDDDLAVPVSYGCGAFGGLVDRRFGLPSDGELALTVYFSVRTYDRTGAKRHERP
ncbi:hypothetical protein Val02_85950 [Virgisporangium aliadipatigenens]|uniref:YceI family protein n=1 Tax=Virgisporangium aliadipatigenens TaxID=741659 RepID=A0A8J3YTQ5_9ACTN|nr:hypothetical protein [Virgisporangium aliadipatigenens]GIJ51709.1 hypothetical protein Val02_85950 [Virgisporangium aliadipatigenens]